MPPSKSSGQTARARRREDFWNRVTFVVGCTSVVAIIASVVAVASQHIMRSSPVVAEAEIRSAAQDEREGKPQVGHVQSEPAQFDIARSSSTGAVEAEKVIKDAASKVPRAVPLADGIQDIEAKRDQISQAVEGFIDARSVEAKLPFVRDPARVKPLMQEYYSRTPIPSLRWRSLGRLVRVDEPGYRFGYVQALFDNASSVTLIIEELDDGSFKVDWECLVRYGELAWQDFLRQRPVEPKLMRVKASRAAAPDAREVAGIEWLQLRHPEHPGTVLASFHSDDPRFTPLLDQLNQGKWKDVPLTLHLAYSAANPALDQVAIASVEGKGWLIFSEHGY